MGDLARFNNLPGVRKRNHFPISPGEKLTIPTTEQLARMPAFEPPVMRDARKRHEREKLATTVAAGLVVAVGGVNSARGFCFCFCFVLYTCIYLFLKRRFNRGMRAAAVYAHTRSFIRDCLIIECPVRIGGKRRL